MNNHYVRSVQIRSFVWPIFSCIQSKCRKIRTRKNSVFGHFSRSEWEIPLTKVDSDIDIEGDMSFHGRSPSYTLMKPWSLSFYSSNGNIGNRVNKTHERASRLAYDDFRNLRLEEILLVKGNSVSIHQQNLRTHAK